MPWLKSMSVNTSVHIQKLSAKFCSHSQTPLRVMNRTQLSSLQKRRCGTLPQHPGTNWISKRKYHCVLFFKKNLEYYFSIFQFDFLLLSVYLPLFLFGRNLLGLCHTEQLLRNNDTECNNFCYSLLFAYEICASFFHKIKRKKEIILKNKKLAHNLLPLHIVNYLRLLSFAMNHAEQVSSTRNIWR